VRRTLGRYGHRWDSKRPRSSPQCQDFVCTARSPALEFSQVLRSTAALCLISTFVHSFTSQVSHLPIILDKMAAGEKGIALLVWIIVFTVLCSMALGLRFWAAILTRRKFFADDFMVVFAFVSPSPRALPCLQTLTIPHRQTHWPWRVCASGPSTMASACTPTSSPPMSLGFSSRYAPQYLVQYYQGSF
jgi:hypothetical protein